MFSARFFLLLAFIIKLIYDVILSKISDIQRKKPLPEEVADIYDAERYQTYLDYTADSKKLKTKYQIINLVIDCVLILSPMYSVIEKIGDSSPYKIFFITYAIIWIISLVIDTKISYDVTFKIMEKYGLNKKDLKEFVKDEVLDQLLNLFVTVVLMLIMIFVGEHMAQWTNNFSVGYVKSIALCIGIFAVIYAFICIARFVSYFVLKKQYIFTPMEEGELKDTINKLQEGSKKKVKNIYVYNESKKSTRKNAFLLKLFFIREFGIADNFMNENAQDELLAVLSHEIGHLKHKKNILNFISYAIKAVLVGAVVLIVANPGIVLWGNEWIRRSFMLSTNNYYLIFLVYSSVIQPLAFLMSIYEAYRSRVEEYEADREAIKNGYGEDLIKTFKALSSDELVNVNPHPFIEFTEYDHPGMYQRIKAIKNGAE